MADWNLSDIVTRLKAGDLTLLTLFRKQRGPPLLNALGDPLMHECAIIGNAAALRILIEAGADPMALDGGEDAPLHCAVRGGKLEATVVLLDAGGNPNSESGGGFLPLHMAVAETEFEVASALLEYAADYELTSELGDTLEGALDECPERERFVRLLSGFGYVGK